MTASSHIIGLIPAAGSGQRLGGELPKQYQALAGLPMLVHTVRALQNHAAMQHIYIVLAEHDTWFESLCSPHLGDYTTLYCGGQTRATSVQNGLHAIQNYYAHETPWVMVHDAARPCLHPDDLSRLIHRIQTPISHVSHAYVLGHPVADTLKYAHTEQATHVKHTVERAGLWHAQTPQVARLDTLIRALESAKTHPNAPTDEAQALELSGHPIELIQAHHPNFKVTYPADQRLAEALIAYKQYI